MLQFDHPPIMLPPTQNGLVHPEWAKWYQRISGELPQLKLYSVTINPASVSANSTATEAFTVTGVTTGDIVLRVIKPTFTAGLVVVEGQVTAANEVTIQFANVTGGAINPASETYKILVLRG